MAALGDDTYVFGTASVAEADVLTEGVNQGTDTLSFAPLTTAVTLNLGSIAVQPVHINRQFLMLNSGGVFENATGGSGADVLTGNACSNRLDGQRGQRHVEGRRRQ